MPVAAPTRDRAIALAALLALVLASACGSSKQVVLPADDLYRAGTQYEQEEYFDAAIDQYKLLLDNYPLDDRAEEVELRIAKVHYANESYPEAIAAFSDFQRMHPTSPKLPEVEYTIGQAYMAQMDTIDRDLGAGNNAALRFESVITRYPRSEEAVQAREKLRETREHLASRELYIANFYYRRGKTRAARGRIIQLVSRYPETPAAQDGLRRLADDARSEGDEELAGLADAALQERIGAAQAEAANEAAAAGGSGPKPVSATATRAGATAALGPTTATATMLRALRERQGRPEIAAAPKGTGDTP
jgi:outer membrane protein assembly factor BamD